MKAMTRTAAALTVLGSLVCAPRGERIAVSQDLIVTPRPAEALPLGFVLPAGWSSSVSRHLQRRRLPIEAGDVEDLMRTVESSARRFHLDPLMVLAVIHVESGFNPYAVSPAGSVGLMQLQTDTARDIAARLSIPWTSDDRLFEPELNILLGTCYLKELLDRFRDPDLALEAFHLGPSRVEGQNLRPGESSLPYAGRVRSTLLELQASTRV